MRCEKTGQRPTVATPTSLWNYFGPTYCNHPVLDRSDMKKDQPIGETCYEKNQRFNTLVAWLHSLRYKNILESFKSVARGAEGNSVKVVEIGCAHAKLFSLLNERFSIEYTGIELDDHSAAIAKSRYAHNSNFSLISDSVENSFSYMKDADVIIALETFEHIPENKVVRIIEAIAAARPTLLLCSVPVEIGPAIWLKNIGSLLVGYMRHTEYRWPETFWAGLYQLDRLPPHGIRHKGFDWRGLAQTIRHNMRIIEIRKFPFNFLPAAFAFSIFVVAEPRQYAPPC